MDEKFYNKNIRYLLAPVTSISADLLLSARCPDDRHQLLLGDFPGDGEHAEEYINLVTDLFYSMSGKGVGGKIIVAELNSCLKDALPTDLFLALCFIEINPGTKTISILNAGMPAPILFRSNVPVAEYASQFIPLGIKEKLDFTEGEIHSSYEKGERLIAYTDGVIEAFNEAGEMYGSDRFLELLTQILNNGKSFDVVMDALTDFQHGEKLLDDVTLVEVQL